MIKDAISSGKMAQQYIYNTDYINKINEQFYKEIGISHDSEQFARKGVKPNKSEYPVIHNSDTYGSQPIKNVISENAVEKKINSITGFGLIILALLIIYFLNKMLFWFIVISFIVCYFSFATKRFGNVEIGDRKLPC